jgi:hypothetical protein
MSTSHVDKFKIPLPGTKNAPEFDGSRPQDLRRFLKRMEDLFEMYRISSDHDRIEQIVKYTDADTEEEWKALETYEGENWNEFKDEIICNYPEAEHAENGAMFRLNDICAQFKDLGINDRSEVLALKRKFVAESRKLRVPPALISNLELVNKFTSCLSADLKAQVLGRLNYHRNDKETKRRREDLYDMDAVVEMTVRLVNEGDTTAFTSSHSRYRNTKEVNNDAVPRGRSILPHPQPKQEIESLAQQVAEIRDRLELSDRANELYRNEMSRNMKHITTALQSIQQNSSQSNWRSNQNQNYNAGMRTNNNGTTEQKCYYCWKAGHMVNSCPDRQRHFDEKKLMLDKDGRFRLPNGQDIPRDNSRSMKDRVEAAAVHLQFEDPDDIALTLNPVGYGPASTFVQNVQDRNRTTSNEDKSNDLQTLMASQLMSMQKSMTELVGEVKSIGSRQSKLEQQNQWLNTQLRREDNQESGF